MRFRYKAWAIPEMEESDLAAIDIEKWSGKWNELFHDPTKPLEVELGCGKGRFLIELAKARPESNFLGVDAEANALITAKRNIEEQNLPNARLARFDIVKIENLFAPESVECLYINFCNPWPKKRHHKRRLTHPRQLVQYRRLLKDQAFVYFKTDDLELYEASLRYFSEFGLSVEQSSADLAESADPIGIRTEYEDKWRGRGIPIKYIKARKEEIAPEIIEERLKQYLFQDP